MQHANETDAPAYKYESRWDGGRRLYQLDFAFHACHQFGEYVVFPTADGYAPTHNVNGWYLSTMTIANAVIVANVTEVSGFASGELVVEACQTSAPYPPLHTSTAPVVDPPVGELFVVAGQCMEIVVRLDRPNATDCRDAHVAVEAALLSDVCVRASSADVCQKDYRPSTSSPSSETTSAARPRRRASAWIGIAMAPGIVVAAV